MATIARRCIALLSKLKTKNWEVASNGNDRHHFLRQDHREILVTAQSTRLMKEQHWDFLSLIHSIHYMNPNCTVLS